jgi:hypothetical protein
MYDSAPLPNQGPNRYQQTLLLLACALFYLAQSLQVWGWPALDGYPAIERWLDPGFLTADFYTNTTVKFGVDTPQAVFFGTISHITGLHYTTQIAGLTVLRHLLWPFILFGFLRQWSGDRLVALWAVALGVLGNFALPKMLGWSWVWGDGSTAMFALLAAVQGWTCFLQRRAALAIWLMALACLIQPLVAVHAMIVVGLIFLADYGTAERWAALRRPPNILAMLVFAAVFATQYLLLTPHGARLPEAEYLHILAYERHPGDFLPSRFGKTDVIAVALAALAVLIMAHQNWQHLQRRGLMLAILATYAAICLAGYLFVEIWPVRLVIDLIPFRTVIIAAPLLLLIIGHAAARLWRGEQIPALALLVLAFAAAGPAAKFGVGALAPAALLLGAALIGFWRGPMWRLPAWIWTLGAVALIIAAIPVAVVRREEMRIPDALHSHALYRWARDATPRDTRFLIEQFSINQAYSRALSPQKMRLIGRRAVVASRDYPFAETDIRPWYRTWVTALNHGVPNRVESADLAVLAEICRQLPFDYVVRAHPLAGAKPVVQFVAQQGVGVIFVYRPCALSR